MTSDRRRNPRYLCSHLVEIVHGESKQHGVLEELSAEGAAVSLDTPIGPGEAVEMVAPGWRARARVRYSKRRGKDFQIGLEFAEGCRWSPDVWQPDHLFLL